MRGKYYDLMKGDEGQQVIEQNNSSRTEGCYDNRTTTSAMTLRRTLRQGGN